MIFLYRYVVFSNKLTPETFEKLSNELLNVGLNSKTIIGGLILLVSLLLKRILDYS